MTWLTERIAEIRAERRPDDDGSLWMVFLDDPYGPPVIASVIEGAMANVSPELTRNLALILEDVAAKAVWLAVPREDGHPRAVDLRLWDELTELVGSSTELLDLVVVGTAAHWSARAGTPPDSPGALL